MALSRRPNSANCRARSPEPRAKLASWLLASSAIVLARGDGVIDRERGERAERHQRRFGAGKAEAQIDHDAERAGDEHHAGRNEDGADTHHAALLPIPTVTICAPRPSSVHKRRDRRKSADRASR